MSINSPKPKYGQNFDKENQNSTKHFQSSFISTSRDQNSIYSSSKTSKKPQKISISSLIKRKSELYLDADLENTFDDLLEKGYNMVITRKNEKEELKQTNNLLQSEIETLEREILPLKNLLNTNKEIQKKLRADSFNAQIEEASHLLVFASFQKITKEHIDDYINLIIKERGTPISELEGLKTALESWHLDQSAEQSSVWAAKQAYIGLGTALIAAAEQKVDATPMEGFDPQNVDEVLKLKEKGLKTAVMLALGYRDAENDWNTNLKKVRLPINEFAVEVK